MPAPVVAGEGALALDVQQFIVAGWTGRDAAAVQHHIDELAAIGVKPPATVLVLACIRRQNRALAPAPRGLDSGARLRYNPLPRCATGARHVGRPDHTPGQAAGEGGQYQPPFLFAGAAQPVTSKRRPARAAPMDREGGEIGRRTRFRS